jgi:hypothetical protein
VASMGEKLTAAFVVRVPGYRPRGLGSIPRFSEKCGSGTGSTQPREYTRGVNGVICVAEK